MQYRRSRLCAFVFAAAMAASLAGLSAVNAGTKVEQEIPGLPAQATDWKPGPEARPLKGTPIENFGVVTPGCLYRSAQPGKGDFEWLAEQGFRSVVSLREEYDDGAEKLKALGLNYLHLKVTDHRIPTDDQARQFLEFVRDRNNWPVLVHCAGGQGRAAIMSALSRYCIDGWDMSDALREARWYRPLNFRMFGEQRRFLNSWKDRFEPGSYHPSKPLPAWPPVADRTARN